MNRAREIAHQRACVAVASAARRDVSAVKRQIFNRSARAAKEAAVAGVRFVDLEIRDRVPRAVKLTGKDVTRIIADRRKVFSVQINVCRQHIIGVIVMPRSAVCDERAQIRKFRAGLNFIGAVLCAIAACKAFGNRRAVPLAKRRHGDCDALALAADGKRRRLDRLVALGRHAVGIFARRKLIDICALRLRRHGGVFTVQNRERCLRAGGKAGKREGHGRLCRALKRLGRRNIRATDRKRYIFLCHIAKETCRDRVASVRQNPDARLARLDDRPVLLDGDGRARRHLREGDFPDLCPDRVEINVASRKRNFRAVRIRNRACRARGPAVKAVALAGEGVRAQIAASKDGLLCRLLRAVVGVENDLVRQRDRKIF